MFACCSFKSCSPSLAVLIKKKDSTCKKMSLLTECFTCAKVLHRTEGPKTPLHIVYAISNGLVCSKTTSKLITFLWFAQK